MAANWTEREKHKAKDALARSVQAKQVKAQRQVTQPQRPPQPRLTPKGPMRETVNRQVREKQAAIKAKFARDREAERER